MKVKRIIEIEESDLALMKKTTFVEDPNTMLHQTAEDRAKTLMMLRFADAIKDSKPYEDSGDLISREALKNIMKCNLRSWGAQGVLADEVMKTIDNAPPVEAFTLEDMQNNYDAGVDSVIGKYDKAKGEWSQYSFHDLGAFGDWDYKCSKCNKVNGWKANFCPNCGADMRGGAE